MQKKKSKPKQDKKEEAELAEEEKKAAENAGEEKKAAFTKEAKKEQKLGESSATVAKATAKTEDGRSSSAKGAITLAKDKHKSLKLPEIMTFFRTASDKEEELCSIETEIDVQSRPGTVIALKAGEEALKTTESIMNILEKKIVNTQGQQSIKHTYICKTKGTVLVHHVGDNINEKTQQMQASTSTMANSEQKHVSSSDTEEEISLPTLADVEGVYSEQCQPKAAQPNPARAVAYVRTKIMEANRLQRREEEWANRHTPEGLALEQRRQAMLARFCPEDVGLIQGPVNPHPEIPDHQAANPSLNYVPLPHEAPCGYVKRMIRGQNARMFYIQTVRNLAMQMDQKPEQEFHVKCPGCNRIFNMPALRQHLFATEEG